MPTRRSIAGACVAVLVALAPGIQAGEAAKPRVASEVTLRTQSASPDFIFRGRVSSRKPACERNRRVRITAGHPSAEEPHLEGVSRTDRNGRYELRVVKKQNNLGGYKATALRKETRRVVCKVARSGVVGP